MKPNDKNSTKSNHSSSIRMTYIAAVFQKTTILISLQLILRKSDHVVYRPCTPPSEISCQFGVCYRGGVWGVQTPPPKFRRPSKIVPNSTRLCKLLKFAEFRKPTPQDVRKKGSKILKLPRFVIVLH